MTDIKTLLPSLNLLALVEKDVPELAGTFNGRYTRHTPCPQCGGDDRFNLRLCADGVQRAYCTQCAPKGLDAIAYVQRRDGLNFKSALTFWSGLSSTQMPATWTATTASTPKAEGAPAEAWQQRAREFVNACAAHLWSGKPDAVAVLNYLRNERALTDDTIRRAKLGYNPKARSAAGADWGLAGREYVRAVQGITIPREIMGELWAVNVRRFEGGKPYAGKDKYICVTGSVLGLAGADGVQRDGVVLAFGGEFDRILAEQHTQAGVACVTFGGEGKNVTQLWRNVLATAKAVHVCMDNDEAGDGGAGRWADVPMARRARVPAGKDLTDYARAGGDVGAWIAETTGVYSWQPPAGDEDRTTAARQWLAVFDDQNQPDHLRARAWARVCMCAGETITSDSRQWLALAQ